VSKKRRLGLIAIAAATFVVIYSFGAETQMSESDAEKLKKEFAEQVKDIDAIGIFLNNFRIAVTMFIPALGVVVGLVSAYSTGMVFNAIVQTTPQLADLSPLIILATPFGVMEMFSYGLAMSQSGILINTIVRKQSLRPMLKPTLIQLGIVAAVLLAGAFIEFYMIKTFEPELETIQTI
jgi:hypothetical protein